MSVNLTIKISPEDYGTASGGGIYEEGSTATVTAIAGDLKKFIRWNITSPIRQFPSNFPSKLISEESIFSFNETESFQIDSNIELTAYFRDLYTFTVNSSTNPKTVGSVRQSANTVYEGYSVTFLAREEKGYEFSHWSNGSTENPVTVTNVTSNIDMVAYYTKTIQVNSNDPYRAFIKDQLALNSLPKLFVTVDSFDIRRDILTSANSKFTILEKVDDINNGDIFVLFSPEGKILYYGVVSSFEDKVINTSQIQSFYKGNWIYDTHESTYIETEFQYLLSQYAQGYQKNSTYQDPLMNQEKAPLNILTGSETSGKLESGDSNEVVDMEEFIYSLYSNYELILDFNIPYNAWEIGSQNGGSVTIRKPTSSVVKVGDNAECILDMSPVTKTEETNKLIIYSSEGVYRTTYVATTTNGIVTEPTSTAGRFGVIDTEIIFSDDELDTIKQANIKEQMYNHKVTFTLILDNNLYDFWSWELGQELQIYKNNDYYNSVFTAYEISKESGKNPISVSITAGKVRTSLVSKLKLGVVR